MAQKTLQGSAVATSVNRARAVSLGAVCQKDIEKFGGAVKLSPFVAAATSDSATAPAIPRLIYDVEHGKFASGQFAPTTGAPSPLRFECDLRGPPLIIRHPGNISAYLDGAGRWDIEYAFMRVLESELGEKRIYRLHNFVRGAVPTTLTVPMSATAVRIMAPSSTAAARFVVNIGGQTYPVDVDRNGDDVPAPPGTSVEVTMGDDGFVVWTLELP